MEGIGFKMRDHQYEHFCMFKFLPCAHTMQPSVGFSLFPDPVLALTRTSLSIRMAGSTCICTGVGVVMPSWPDRLESTAAAVDGNRRHS